MTPSSPTVRVFICSTFRDMVAEREFLHRQVFPRFRFWFHKKGVALEVVDLGWKATEDQAEGFDALKSSLDEVDRCRPFFLGLIGQRYGRGLTQIRRDVAAIHPWLLKATKGTSRMHLEMLHGVLNDPGRASGCFFYLRSPDYLSRVPVKDACRHLIPDTPGEDNRRQALVKALRASGRPVREYPCFWDSQQKELTELRSLARLIAEDLDRAVHEHLFPGTPFVPSLADEFFPVEMFRQATAEDLRGGGVLPPPAAAPFPKRAKRPAAKEPSPPPCVDENVQFTVYRPKVVQPEKWYDLLAIAHLVERRPDAPPDEPDPLEQVKTIVKQRLGDKARDYQDVKQDSTQAIPRHGEITFVPEMPDVVFNPPRRTFLWLESVHPEEFRLMANSKLDGQTARGRLTVFLGAILIADVPLAFRVDSKHQPKSQEPQETSSAQPYRKIFASYSHKDLPIVEQFEKYAQTLGDEVLRDWKHLRPGDVWNDKLMRMIEQSDVFQLFWSSNSMTSDYVRQEYEHALGLNRANFIRPTYWEDPMPTSKSPPLPPPALARLHFQRIGAGLVPHTHPTMEQEEESALTLEDIAFPASPPVVDVKDASSVVFADINRDGRPDLVPDAEMKEASSPSLEEEAAPAPPQRSVDTTDFDEEAPALSGEKFEESEVPAAMPSTDASLAYDDEDEEAPAPPRRSMARRDYDDDFEEDEEEEESRPRTVAKGKKPRAKSSGAGMLWLVILLLLLILLGAAGAVVVIFFPDLLGSLFSF